MGATTFIGIFFLLSGIVSFLIFSFGVWGDVELRRYFEHNLHSE